MSRRFAEISIEQRRAAHEWLIEGGVVEVGGWKHDNTGAIRTSTKGEYLLGSVRNIPNTAPKTYKTTVTAKFPEARNEIADKGVPTGKNTRNSDEPPPFSFN